MHNFKNRPKQVFVANSSKVLSHVLDIQRIQFQLLNFIPYFAEILGHVKTIILELKEKRFYNRETIVTSQIM